MPILPMTGVGVGEGMGAWILEVGLCCVVVVVVVAVAVVEGAWFRSTITKSVIPFVALLVTILDSQLWVSSTQVWGSVDLEGFFRWEPYAW